jgi:hypothetical protein
LTRRVFLRRSVAASLLVMPWIIPSCSRGGKGCLAPGERINVGLIGCGTMGGTHLEFLAGHKQAQLVAVCDVDRLRRERGVREANEISAARRGRSWFRRCAGIKDYRQLLARPDIDAVVIATPDHWHSLLAMHAAQAGKDIYCEKPVSLTIREGREMVNTIRRYARVFQTGSQYRSIPTLRQVCQFVRAGGLGKVKSVFTHWVKSDVPTVGQSYVPLDPALPAEPAPGGLDRNRWVGPASWRPYNSAYHRNPSPGVVPWSFCNAFGAGAVTVCHSHSADIIQYAIGLETSGPVEVIHPSSGQFPTLSCRYANDVLLHHVESWEQAKQLYKAVPADAQLSGLFFGGLFVGERGWITSMATFFGAGRVEGGPEDILREAGLTTREINVGANNHHANWFECIRSRALASAHEEIGHRSASLGHLVAISCQLQRSLRWDPVQEAFLGDDEANRLLSRAYREPWLP